MMCQKCLRMTGWLILIIGIGYLVADWTTWAFWGINPWTFAFLLIGLSSLGMSSCADCQKCRCSDSGKVSSKKK